MLTDPVVGPLQPTTPLVAREAPQKLTAFVTLDRVRPDVDTTPSPLSDPRPHFDRTLLDDTHTVPTAPLPPIRLLTLRSTAPTLDTSTVILTDPVVGQFEAIVLLVARDTPA
jgi:hypothetical protein